MAEPQKRKPASRRPYRRCSACGRVSPAAELPRVSRPLSWSAARWSRCPGCGHEALTRTFLRVAAPAGGEVTR
jgi:hypothetical protein